MSLKAFHVFFIFLSIVFSAWFGVWLFENVEFSHPALRILFAGLAFATAVGLGFYLLHFVRQYRSISYVAFAVALLPLFERQALACATCFGDPNSEMAQSATAGVWVLLVIIGGVLSGFAGLFIYWMKRAKQHPEA